MINDGGITRTLIINDCPLFGLHQIIQGHRQNGLSVGLYLELQIFVFLLPFASSPQKCWGSEITVL